MASVDYVNTLGAGAGFDTKALVSSLVEAERAPKRAVIDRKMDDAQLELSGIAKAAAALNNLDAAALKLNDDIEFNNYNVSNSQTSALTVTANGLASEGTHTISISAIAAEKRMVSGDFVSRTTQINGGNAFDLTMVIGNTSTTTHTINVTTATPDGVVAAINDADLGIKAEILQTGASGTYKIQVVGETGSEQTYSITSPPSDLSFTSVQNAADATLVVDGVTFTRSTNTFSDVITGATIALHSTTSSAASVSLNNDKTAVKTDILSFVSVANDTISTLRSLLSRSENGELAGNTVVRQMERQIFGLITNLSSTPGTSITRLSELGISVTRDGSLSIDETVLDSQLATNFSDIRKVFSANTDSQTTFGTANRGVAGDLSKYIQDLSTSSGYFTTRVDSINTNIERYSQDLTDLETKLAKLQERYTQQFAAMQRVVNEMNTLGEGLKSSFDNLPYNNRNK